MKKRALCCEWLAGSLAKAIGLPIPSFARLQVSEDLVSQSLLESVGDLGSGLVFGSHDIGDAQELGVEDARRLIRQDPNMALSVLVFDWWIQNTDRTLGDRGGNPNILFGASDQRMEIIDHNLAFDEEWQADGFFVTHVFASVRQGIAQTQLGALRDRLRSAAGRLDLFWSEIPESWLFLDADGTVPIELTKQRVCSILDRVEREWEGTWS